MNNKKFKRGLVVGKFSPIHHGHGFLINNAIEQCNEVLIISYCKPEIDGCNAERIEIWLSLLFPRVHLLIIDDERFDQYACAEFSALPLNNAPEIIHRNFCGFLCHKVLGLDIHAVFTSENYGEGFAQDLTKYMRKHNKAIAPIQHVLVDLYRDTFPISATQIRKNIHAHRKWLHPIVYANFVKRICILGGESTGKSTLAAALAKKFDTCHVAEYGRELWEQKKGMLTFDDMQVIARIQIDREEKLTQSANQFLFCDTSPLTTLFYSLDSFGLAAPELHALAERSYDMIFLCATDFDFQQDGTRRGNAFRFQQNKWYANALRERDLTWTEVSGNVEQRIAQIKSKLAEAYLDGFKN